MKTSAGHVTERLQRGEIAGGRRRWKRHALALALLAAIIGLAGRPAAAAAADDEAIRKEIDALKQRLEALERQLAERAKPAPTPAPGEAEALKAKQGSRFEVGGLAQMRFTNVGSQSGSRTTDDVTDFQVTRFLPRFSYQMDSHWLATLQLNATTRGNGTEDVGARDVYVQYQHASRAMDYAARMGQQKIPYGYQVFREGSQARAALERARVFAEMFPNSRDIGLVLERTPRQARAPVISLGVVNGDGVNESDGDKPKSVAGNVVVALGKHNVVGGSVYSGTTTETVNNVLVSRVKKAYGIEHRLQIGRLSTQLEYLWGRGFGADLNGGYAQLLYDTGRLASFFVRHDLYDPNEDAAQDYWHRTSLGWYKDVTRQLRLTLEYDFVTDRLLSDAHVNTFGVQVQGGF